MFVVVDGIDLSALASEASARRPGAAAVRTEQTGYSDELDAFRGRRRHHQGAGEQLSALHEGALLARLVAAAWRSMRPTRASYLYFGVSDHVGFHQDAPQCSLTAAACLAGEPPALLLLAGERGGPAALRRRLQCESPEQLAASCDHVRLVPGRLVLFEGHVVPHALSAPSGEVTLAACCFASADV